MYGLQLPDYPWDTLTPYRQRAAAHPDGVCDLSIGTPVDPTPEAIRQALREAADAHGYPTTAGTDALREAIAWWSAQWRGVTVDPATEVLPTVGSKELVAWLPTLLGLSARGASGLERPMAVACPSQAYPTYEMGARLAGVDCVRLDAADILAGASLEGIGLLWLNSPGNPTGEVLDTDTLAAVVARAREAGVIVASDECYALLNWAADTAAPSILDPAVTGGEHTGLLAVYSMSKQSNLAGYRAAFVTGDAKLIGNLTNSRKHAGMILPAPIQAAMIAGLRDTAHVQEQKARYAARRTELLPAAEAFGLRIDHSTAGLYLWASRDEDCWETIAALADLGIIAGPGAFYGAAAGQHVRLALTAPDERIAAAAARLREA
ncbi:succinyldiaminopimelate transaminase [Brevibacterium gallinarum]|uniref:Aminotransferase n=1 Tax=Brevibacterium gallinarum TaxID=2762220 RepID=A0ABR8WUR5_9MICO|nr:succinyldiaminopimelate transaminase [Brevibacterium gallinarum]MBD8020391.1 succinyldiaminopimelate transaminase [Brevibacterium gallinarum]